ncbi:MAG: hypothetical protein JSV29_02165 [Candidatus Bathyarchaeota archaeon]|nr:MAG: hypothetical protein JSV29_02165 [Candidatus Bathyarchaeota archaeon]
MSRYYFDKKNTVEESTELSIFKLKEFGLLTGYAATTLRWKWSLSGRKSSIGICVDTEELYAKVNYTVTDRNTGKKTDYDYKISLTTTPCNYGGVRYWFICPLSRNGVYCGRRTGTLYIASGGNYFGCRHCYDLSYESRNESRLGRFGNIGYTIVAERKIEELYNQIKRWTYKGKPTKKARKLKALEAKLNTYLDSPSINDLLLNKT